MIFIQAIILGIIQGLTEYLPISSSAHLIIVPWALGWDEPIFKNLPFDVSLHLGTLVAIILFFAKDWVILLKAFGKSLIERKIGADPNRRLAWLLAIGSIPGGIVGILAESKIENLFHQPDTPIATTAIVVMVIIIALLGLVLYLADKTAKHLLTIDQITLKDVLIIGVAQAAAVFPGVSRSGATITAGLTLGFKRADAAKFSFLLAAPIIAGAGLKSLLDLVQLFKDNLLTKTELLVFPIGFLAAATSGYYCIKFLLRYLQNNSIRIFVYYRWLLAIFLLATVFLRK